jgi:hypothetical protein
VTDITFLLDDAGIDELCSIRTQGQWPKKCRIFQQIVNIRVFLIDNSLWAGILPTGLASRQSF